MDKLAYQLSNFEGPLDLLLYLVEKNKMDIYDIPIVEIADQFHAYVQQMPVFDIQYGSRFLVMAATLLQMKSRYLLPKQQDENKGEDLEEDKRLLEKKLAEYKFAKDLALHITACYESQKYFIGRSPMALPEATQFMGTIEQQALYETFLALYQKAPEEEKKPVAYIEEKNWNVDEKIEEIKEWIGRWEEGVSVSMLLHRSMTRYELLTIFLAVLEVLRMEEYVLKKGADGLVIQNITHHCS